MASLEQTLLKPALFSERVVVREFANQQDYQTCWKAMQNFTDQRQAETPDELWLLEHPPVFTQGQSGKAEHILQTCEIPIIPIDRGGQVTYHGPGQFVVYTLVDLQRKQLSIRQFVTKLEQSIVLFLDSYGIKSETCPKAPGVYVAEKKIASIGLRVRRGLAFHGLALNVDMDLKPFSYINPCGCAGLKMTQLSELTASLDLAEARKRLIDSLSLSLGYNDKIYSAEQA